MKNVYLSSADAAKILGISRSWVHEHVNRGHLKVYGSMRDGTLLFREKQVLRLKKQRELSPPVPGVKWVPPKRKKKSKS